MKKEKKNEKEIHVFKAYIRMVLGIFWERERSNEMYKWYRPHAVVSSSLRFLRKQQQVYAMRSLYIYIASLKYESDFHFSAKNNNNNKTVYISKLMSSDTSDL